MPMPRDEEDDLFHDEDDLDFDDDGEDVDDDESEEAEVKKAKPAKRKTVKKKVKKTTTKKKSVKRKKKKAKPAESAEESKPAEESEAPADEVPSEESIEGQEEGAKEGEEKTDDLGRPEPPADHVVHIYELGRLKRTLEREFTAEDADAFATNYSVTCKHYGRQAVMGKKDTQPAKVLE